jgi:Ni,Fe-hydrogenase III small subunit
MGVEIIDKGIIGDSLPVDVLIECCPVENLDLLSGFCNVEMGFTEAFF